jgi:Yip1-like protein
MSDAVTVEAGGAPPAEAQGLAARVVGVLFSPRRTYAAVAARPRSLGVLLTVALLGALTTFAFLSTDVGQQATFDQQLRTMESFGIRQSEAAVQRLEDGLPRARYFGAVGQIVFFPLAALIVSGIAYGVFTAVAGADRTFRQVFAVVAHSGVVIAVSQLFTLPLDYARETLSSPTNLGVFLPFLDDASFPARLLGVIDLFHLWWMLSLAIGLAVLYRRRTQPVAATVFSVYLVVVLIIAAIKSTA